MKRYITIVLACLSLMSCNKVDDWLDVKQNKNELVPVSLNDYQALLDNPAMYQNFCSLGLVSSDNFYVTDADFNSATELERNAYTWKQEVYQGVSVVADWTYSYRRISVANIVLDGVQELAAGTGQEQKDNLRGQALFYRSIALFELLQLFASQYQSLRSAADPGVPILTSSDINSKVERSSVEACYQQVITDLKQAEEWLPQSQPYLSRPSGLAARALLARVYLQMGDYENARDYARRVLAIKSELYDFKTISVVNSRQFPALTASPQEVIFYGEAIDYAMVTTVYMGRVDSLLYKSYAAGDLRKELLFRTYSDGRRLFKGTYTGAFTLFGGIGVNELYLIEAEGLIRTGEIAAGIARLNELLARRFSSGTFVPYTSGDADQALSIVIAERRKELPFTGQLRWMDIRRLNTQQASAVTLQRQVGGEHFQLTPQSNRFVFPIPPEEMLYSNLPQTPR